MSLRFFVASQWPTPEDPAALTTTWFDAWRTKGASAIARMMAPDYVYVAPNGSLMDRAAILAIAADPTYGITEGTHDGVTVIALGPDVALVLHHWRGRGTLRGQVFADDHQCVMVWHRVERSWRVRYEQASLLCGEHAGAAGRSIARLTRKNRAARRLAACASAP